MKTFEKYREPFLIMLEELCISYKAIGMGTFESPMWQQYQGIYDTGDEEQRPKFRSSQSSLGFFLNYVDEEDKLVFRHNFSKIYDFFKSVKYAYIEENHPTIYKELRN